MLTRERAKASLKRKGWSNRRAASLLEVSFQHLSYVLNGRRESESLLARIDDLPQSPIKYRKSGFARVRRNFHGRRSDHGRGGTRPYQRRAA